MVWTLHFCGARFLRLRGGRPVFKSVLCSARGPLLPQPARVREGVSRLLRRGRRGTARLASSRLTPKLALFLRPRLLSWHHTCGSGSVPTSFVPLPSPLPATCSRAGLSVCRIVEKRVTVVRAAAPPSLPSWCCWSRLPSACCGMLYTFKTS